MKHKALLKYTNGTEKEIEVEHATPILRIPRRITQAKWVGRPSDNRGVDEFELSAIGYVDEHNRKYIYQQTKEEFSDPQWNNT